MSKNIVGLASVIKNTTRLVSSTSNNCNGVRTGSFLKFQSDPNHYIINNVKSLIYLCEFNKISPNEVEINEDSGINIGIGDEITISFKEFELQTILSIINPGSNYKIGDVISIDGGVVLKDIRDNTAQNIQITVNNINENGGITKLGIENRGKLVELPIAPFKVIGGSGSGAELDVQFKKSSSRSFIEKTIESIKYDGQKTTLKLTYPLPEEIKSGKLSVDKWEIFLTTDYIGESKVNSVYEITHDFTPNFGFPMMIKNTTTPDTVYNAAIQMLDRKIKELEDRINSLTKT